MRRLMPYAMLGILSVVGLVGLILGLAFAP
jgi:hypothetical protein